jgi:hypothetical protein
MVLGLLGLGFTRADAYDPGIHTAIAERAVRQFRECTRADARVSAVGEREWRAIADASHAEDSPSWTRLVNWHFLNPTIDSAPYWGIAEMSMVPLVESVATELARTNGDHRLELVGRALHYVEDATVPAHVVPAYHGPRAPGMGLERGGWVIKDEVDDYPKTHPEVWFTLDTGGICRQAREMARAHPGVVDLLEQVANQTRDAIDEPVPDAGALTWKTLFWVDAQDGEFFGRYNVPPNGPGMPPDCSKGAAGYFGKETVCDPAGQQLRIAPDVYRNFVRGRLRAAIIGDVAVLYAALAPPR